MVKIGERLSNAWLAVTDRLPTPTNKKRRKLDGIKQQQVYQYRLDVNKWRMAQNAAKDLNYPDRSLLHDIFLDISVDTHLTSVIQTRKINVMGKPFKLVNFTTGKEDKSKTALFKAPWFREFVSLAMDANFWGHSLIEFEDLQNGYFTGVKLVPRSNVIPEFGLIKENFYGGGEVFDFRNDPALWVVEVGSERDLGLLEKAAPHVIWKRAAMAAWSEYCEVFGSPIRWMRTDATGDDLVALESMMVNMGSNAWGISGKEDEFEFLQVARTDAYEVYLKRIELTNSEISKLILGQTMTTENGSSRSQAEVHERVSAAYTLDDMQKMEDLINFKLIPFLVQRGYPLQGFSFQWDISENLDLKTQSEIIGAFIDRGYNVPEKHITETFGFPIEGRTEPKKLPPGDPDENFKKGLPVKGAAAGRTALMSVLMRDFTAKYTHTCSHGKPLPVFTAAAFDLDAEIERLVIDFHAGRINDIILDSGLYRGINKALTTAAMTGYRAKSVEEIAFLKNNLQVFSAFKTFQELRSMSDLLVNKDTGNIRGFADYKKEVLKLHQAYNVNYLQAEYQHAVGSAQMARKWKDFERDGGNITYQTVGDARVRPEHVEYDEVTLPVTHPWWKTHYPPNGWACRCTVTDGPDVIVTPDEVVNGLPTLPDPMFAGNPGIDGIIFPEAHPYMTRGITPEVRKKVLEEMEKIETE